jgi:flagellar basal body rod protein FlgF
MSKKETAETAAQTTISEPENGEKLSRYYNTKDVTKRREIREDIVDNKQYVFYTELTTNADTDGNKEITLEIGIEKIDGGVIEEKQSMRLRQDVLENSNITTLSEIITMLQITKQDVKNFINYKK